MVLATPSPSQRFTLGPSLSRFAGEGLKCCPPRPPKGGEGRGEGGQPARRAS